jgi:hypothetical protein
MVKLTPRWSSSSIPTHIPSIVHLISLDFRPPVFKLGPDDSRMCCVCSEMVSSACTTHLISRESHLWFAGIALGLQLLDVAATFRVLSDMCDVSCPPWNLVGGRWRVWQSNKTLNEEIGPRDHVGDHPGTYQEQE